MATPRSELFVITATKNLVDYVMTISEKSPKKYRYSLLPKMHTCLFDALELLYEASIEGTGHPARKKKQDAYRVKLRIIGTLGDYEQKYGCFKFHQFEAMSNRFAIATNY